MTTTTTMAISVSDLQTRFIARIHNRLAAYARRAFRYVASEHDREDRVADTVDMGWDTYQRQMERGKDPEQYFATWARYLVLRVKEGKRVQGCEHRHDISNAGCQLRNGIKPHSLDTGTYSDVSDAGSRLRNVVRSESGTVLADRSNMSLSWLLAETRNADPSETAAARIDVENWLSQHSPNVRFVAENLALGYGVIETGNAIGVSRFIVCMIRKTLESSWEALQAD